MITIDGDHHFREEMIAVRTREDGRFRFIGLPQSDCYVRATKVGYWTEPYRNGDFRARADAFPSIVSLKLHPTGVLNIRVLDQNGALLDGTQVAILSRGKENRIDDNRVISIPKMGYRMESIRSSHLLLAMSPGPGTLLRALGQTFLRTYYPGTTVPEEAKWIEIIPGKETNVEFRVTLIAGKAIHGRLGFAGRVLQISVVSSTTRNYYVNWGLANFKESSGEFWIDGLTPGDYRISLSACVDPKCSSGATAFVKTVAIGNADLDNLVIS